MSDHPRTADLAALLQALDDAGIEFIVVGGVAAVLHGAPITTQDLDIVHRRTAANVARLVGSRWVSILASISPDLDIPRRIDL